MSRSKTPSLKSGKVVEGQHWRNKNVDLMLTNSAILVHASRFYSWYSHAIACLHIKSVMLMHIFIRWEAIH